MTGFCGEEIFWNSTQFMSSSWPNMSDCFQLTFLVVLPCGWLWLALTPHLYFLFRHHHGVTIATNKLHLSKLILSAGLAIVAITEVIRKAMHATSHHQTLAPVVWLTFAISLASYILTCILIHVERIKGLTTSIVLWVFWCLSLLSNVIPFYTNFCDKEYEIDKLLFSLFYIKFICLSLQIVLATIVERSRQQESGRASPELTASVPSRLVFWWISSFIYRTSRQGLQEETLFGLHPRDKVSRVASHFEHHWKSEWNRYHDMEGGHCKGDHQSYSSFETVMYQGSVDESTPLVNRTPAVAVSNGDSGKVKKPSLFKVLIAAYGMEIIQSHFFMLVFDLLQFANPMLLGTLIQYAQDKRKSRDATPATTTPEWPGYVIALAFFMVALVSSVTLNQCYHLGMTLGMRVKDALLVAVYKKSLSRPTSGSHKLKTEETVKLMSVDCQRVQDLMSYLWMVWSAPFEIVLSLYLLWHVIGFSMLWGVAVMVFFMPVNATIAFRQRSNLDDLAKVKAKRIKLTRELVEGMQVFKTFAWERHFQTWIERIRLEEVNIMNKSVLINSISAFCWACSPLMVLIATFANYVMTSDDDTPPLSAYQVFVTLSLFNILRFPVNLLPMLFSLFTQGISTVDRLAQFLNTESETESTLDVHKENEYAIQIERGHFSWNQNTGSTTLSNIDIRILPGQLVAVVGQNGSGKSSLLSAILGQMHRVHGNVKVTSSNIVHVPQKAWVQSTSVKDNILFGKVKDPSRYNKAIDACGLRSEIDLLHNTDKTEIGERGGAMTESQKQRIALARAVYSKADIYLLDQPLNDVTPSVTANQIFTNIISNRGMLKKTTRVLVTNNAQWMSQADLVVMVTDGRVSEMGSFDQLYSKSGHLARYLRMSNTSQTNLGDNDWMDNGDGEAASPGTDVPDFDSSLTSEGEYNIMHDDLLKSTESAGGSTYRKCDFIQSMAIEDEIRERDKQVRQMLLSEERSEIRRVKLTVFWHYVKVIGLTSNIISLVLFAAYQVVSVYSHIWLSVWTQHGQEVDASNRTSSGDPFYLGIYGGIGIFQAVFVISFSIVSSHGMSRVSQSLHQQVLSSVIKSPMTFFDQMPTATIVNRFARDVDVLDTLLPLHVHSWMNTFFGTVSTLFIVCFCSPYLMLVVVPLIACYCFIQSVYVPTSRQLKNLESTSRTCVNCLFRDTLTGVTTIRTLGACDRFVALFLEKMEKTSLFHFASISTNRWLSILVELLGNVVVVATVLLTINVGEMDESLVGLAVTFALHVTSCFSWTVRASTDLETNIYSVQRMKELTQIAPESSHFNLFKRPQAAWPQQGAIHFFNCTTQSRLDLYPALKPLNLYIQGGEKIGIVSWSRMESMSIRDALFRIVEATSGSIIIDNTIISDIGLQDLRSRMTFLPGVPVLFSGTVRKNMDPANAFHDDDVWVALETARVKNFFSTNTAGLRFDCGDHGSNLSFKRRHQVGLARALLHRKKILVMEEAGGDLDSETEDLLQTTVRSHFRDSTVLTFALRINTVADYDRVVVLDQGKVVEVDNPKTLLRNKSSLLYDMASEANLL